jgi:hypothetical protein
MEGIEICENAHDDNALDAIRSEIGRNPLKIATSYTFDALNALTRLSQLLHEWMVSCLGIPAVMSTLDRRHVTHMLEGFCNISVPHMQHRMVGIVAWNSVIFSDLGELQR